MRENIERIEIHRVYPNSYVVIYYQEDNEHKKIIYNGDEKVLERLFNKDINELRKIYDISVIAHQKEIPQNIGSNAIEKQVLLNNNEKVINASRAYGVSKNPNYRDVDNQTRIYGELRDYSYRNVERSYSNYVSNDKRISNMGKIHIKKLALTGVTIGIIAATLVSGYAIHKNNSFKKALTFHNSKIIEYRNVGTKLDKEDKALYTNYERFEEIFNALKEENYDTLKESDIAYFTNYLDGLFRVNNENNFENGKRLVERSAFTINFIEQFEEITSNQKIKVSNIERAYNSIFSKSKNDLPYFDSKNAYDYCKLASDYVKEDYSYKGLPKLEKLILLKQLYSVVCEIHFNYSTTNNPASWVFTNGYNYDDFVNFLNSEIQNVEKDLKNSCAIARRI